MYIKIVKDVIYCHNRFGNSPYMQISIHIIILNDALLRNLWVGDGGHHT